jgi:DNA-binding HxlR family transcriptional regulator
MAANVAGEDRLENQWRDILSVHARTMCEIDRALHPHGLGASALSRLIGRLEKDGLVERTSCLEDRRGVWVALTRKGRDLHTEVRPLQRAVLTRMLNA